MPGPWRITLPAGAIRNCNISLRDSPFHLRPYIGGTNENDAPAKRLSIEFFRAPKAEMWVYGDKRILTPRAIAVQAFFDANGITDAKPVELEISQLAPGTLAIKKV